MQQPQRMQELQVLEFQMSSKKCLGDHWCEVYFRSQLTIRFLDPRKMASSKEHCTKWLTKTLTYLKEKKRVREQDCDDIISEYCLLTEVVTEVNKSRFAEFNPAADRVDTSKCTKKI